MATTLSATKSSSAIGRNRFRARVTAMTNFIKDYFDQSSIHGLFYLFKPDLTLIERCLWLVLVITSIYACLIIGLQSVNRFYTKNTVVGLERDFYYWNTSMPSLTVCPLKRLDATLFNNYCREHKIDGQQKEEFFHFLESLANSTYKNFKNIPIYKSIDTTLEQLNIRPADYIKLIYNLTDVEVLSREHHIESKEKYVYCTASGTLVHVRIILTEYGLCYLTNSYLDESYSARYLIFGEYDEYDYGKVEVVNGKTGSYFHDDMNYDLIGKSFDLPIDIFFHSPYEVMEVDHNWGYTMHSMLHVFECTEMVTEDKFEESATISQRNCRFQHEANLTHFPIYTKNLCLQECRLNLAYKVCGCIPHFYPNRVGNVKPVCSYKVLRDCFPQNENYFVKLYREKTGNPNEVETVQCNCLQNCRDIIVNKRESIRVHQNAEVISSNSITVAMNKNPTMRLRRQIIFSFTDLLVSIGGTAGLFLGFSVLAAAETIYYVTIRLLFFILGYKQY